MDNKKLDYQINKLPIRVLKVDSYQKKLRSNVIDKIVNEYDPIAFGLIHVSLRDDGTYWVFDGQHRTEAAKIMGFTHLDCLVFTGLTFEQESRGFLGHHNVSKPTKIEEHNGRLLSGDFVAKDIEMVANELNLRIVAGGMKNTVQSVTTLYQIYNKNGRKILSDVLRIVRDGFEDVERPYKVHVLKAIRDMLVEYGSHLDKKWLIKKLKQEKFNELNKKADAFIEVYNFNKVEGMKMAITQCYNHRKSEHLKLK